MSSETDSDSQQHPSLSLRGFGIPLNQDESHRFPSTLTAGQEIRLGRLIPLREFTMLHIMDEVTSRPRWQERIHNEIVAGKWRDEMINSGRDVSEAMADYIIDELCYKADVFAVIGAIVVFDDGVVKSNTIVSPEIKAALADTVKLLENVPDREKDWRSGSDGKVLDLVDPSLFPLSFGQSKIVMEQMGIEEGLEMSGNGVVIPVPPEFQTGMLSNSDNPFTGRNGFEMARVFSNSYQWLPCEVDLQGPRAKIASYINNLHPVRHKELYGLIEQLIDRAIPLWEMALSPMLCSCGNITRIEYKEPRYQSRDDESGPGKRSSGKRGQVIRNSTKRVTIQPEPQPFEAPFPPGTESDIIKLREKFKGLQVFVKMFNVMLTPENPEYEGGEWHFEGIVNEYIVASALYCYSSENITAPKVAFRKQCKSELEDIEYDEGDYQWLKDVFGLRNFGSAVQNFGSVETLEGRLLAFPNILQNREEPFQLVDRTKPGHSKMVALFLVDPHIRLISTANVPCQRMDWWHEALESKCPIPKFPPELLAEIVENMEFPITMEQAKNMREEMTEERDELGSHATNSLVWKIMKL